MLLVDFVKMILGFLFQLLTLLVSFFIAFLNLMLDFARSLIGSVM